MEPVRIFSFRSRGKPASLSPGGCPKEEGTVLFKSGRDSFSWQEADLVVVFDGEGRLYSHYRGHSLYRRGMDSRVLKILRVPDGKKLVRTPVEVSEKEALSLFQEVRGFLEGLRERLVSGEIQSGDPTARPAMEAALERALRYGPAELMDQRRLFHEIYKRVSVLPPDQYMALVVQITHGCSYNECTFCHLYRDRGFQILNLEEVKLQIDRIREFLGRALTMRKGIFLGDGNPLVVSNRRLVPLLRLIRQEFRETSVLARGIFTFSDIQAVLRKTDAELAELRREGLCRVYLGLESGSARLLEAIGKPASRAEQISAVKRLKEAGLATGVIFMAGLGGPLHAGEHVAESAALIRQLPLAAGDLIYLSNFFPIHGTPYLERQAMEFGVLNHQEVRRQIEDFRRRIDLSPGGVKFAPYDLNGFLY
jgi:radical SAM superfamily enzyme YgiQ (UPF0313 family)